MKFGLSSDTLQAINAVFGHHPAVERVVLYGSRALGTYHAGSDIDLAVSGSQLPFRQLLDLMIELDELELLYRFDVSNLSTISNSDLLDHIRRVGVVIYQAPETVLAQARFQEDQLTAITASRSETLNKRMVGFNRV